VGGHENSVSREFWLPSEQTIRENKAMEINATQWNPTQIDAMPGLYMYI